MKTNADITQTRVVSPLLKKLALSLFFTFASCWNALALYWGGGSSDLSNGTPLPTSVTTVAGTWNLTTKNWSLTNAPGTYGAYVNDSFVDLGYVVIPTTGGTATITNETDVSLSGLMGVTHSDATPTLYNQRIVLNATSSKTLTFTGTNFLLNAYGTDNTRGITVEANVKLAGNAPISSMAVGGRFVLKSNSPNLTSPFAVRNSNVVFEGDGALPSVPSWDLKTLLYLQSSDQTLSYPRFYVTRPSVSALNQLNDAATVTLSYGYVAYKGVDHATTPSSETLKKITLAPFGVLDLATIGNGNASAVKPALILADASEGLGRGARGTGMLSLQVPTAVNTGVTIGVPASDLIVSNGITANVFLPWISTSTAEFMQLNDTTKVLERIVSTSAPTDFRTWVAGTDYRIGSGSSWVPSGSITNNLSINSLGIYATTTDILPLTIDSGKTLTLASGAFAQMAGSNGKTYMITNGMLTSGSGTLYIHKSIDAFHGNLKIYSSITGSGMNLIKAGLGELFLEGPVANTYSGTTYVSGPMTVNKSGTAVAVPGNLVIQTGGKFKALGTAPISSTSTVTIDEGGVWNHGVPGSFVHGGTVTLNGGCYYLQNTTPIFAAPGNGLVFSDGGRIFMYSSSPGSLSLQTTVSYLSSATRQARVERCRPDGGFNVELDGAQRSFEIADSATLPNGLPEMVIDTAIIPGSPAGGSLRKTGTGTLQLTDANTYAGGTSVEGGTLQVSKISAPAQSGLTASFMAAPNLITFTRPVARRMVVRQPIGSTSNTGFTAKRYISEILNDYQIITDAIGGAGRPTDVYVEAVSRSGSLGTGAVIVKGAGSLLKIDSGITLANTVTVTNSATLAASGAGLGSLKVSSGTVSVSLASGSLALSGTLILENAALTLDSAPGDVPVTILSAAGGVTGKFTTIPDQVSVLYYPTSIVIGKLRGTSIVVR